MTERNLLSKLVKLTFAIICVLLCFKLVPIQIANSLILAKNPSTKKSANRPTSQTTNAPKPPDPTSQPSPSGQDGKSERRGPCENIQPGITVLAPNQNVLISKENPTFWFYMPYKSELINSTVLLWRDETGRLYRKNLARPATPGIVNVTVPSEAPPLKEGKEYSFTLAFNVYCGSNLNDKVKVDSVPVRVQVKQFSLSQGNTAVQRANIYAQKGFWFNALTEIAELKRSNPTDENWTKIVHSMNLMDSKIIEAQPIVDCCIPRSPQSR